MSRPTVIKTAPHRIASDSAALEAIVDTLLSEKTVAMPTDTIYGLHGLARSPLAITALDSAKTRSSDQPYVVLVADISQAADLGVAADDRVLAALDRIWPAPLTALLEVRESFPAIRNERTVALRVPALDWLVEVLARSGPLASTSLNRRGELPASTLPGTDVLEELGVALGVDQGPSTGQASTIVDFTKTSPELVREGSFRFTQKLWKSLWKTL